MTQPDPKPGVYPITELVIEDLKRRSAQGVRTYGTTLHSHNGRDALVDAYEEALDKAQYLRQAIAERGWVSFEDGTPREGEWVLVTDGMVIGITDWSGDKVNFKPSHWFSVPAMPTSTVATGSEFAHVVWEMLGRVPVDDYGLLQEPFMGWPVGTDREEVWSWIVSSYGVSMAELMGVSE